MGGYNENASQEELREDQRMDGEVRRLERESQAFEQETLLWIEAQRLVHPPLNPSFKDIAAASELLVSLLRAKRNELASDSADARLVETHLRAAQKINAEVRERLEHKK